MYRTDGFNSSRVTLTNQATRATGLVALTVNVDEGPQQVVSDITIEGTRRTSPSLVSRSLRLEPGQPVDLTAWAQSRKRLFDTGVFRQVDIQAVPSESPFPAVPAAGAATAERIRGCVRPAGGRARGAGEFRRCAFVTGSSWTTEFEPAAETTTLRPAWRPTYYRNVFGRAASTGLALRYTKDFRSRARLSSRRRFFRQAADVEPVSCAVARGYRGLVPLPAVVDKTLLSAEQRFRPWRRLQMSYGYSYERNRTFRKDPNPEIRWRGYST